MLPKNLTGGKRLEDSGQRSLTYNLHEYSLASTPIELTVENLLPRPKIQLALGNRHDHLAPHQLALDMGVAIVLSGFVVPIDPNLGANRSKNSS